MKFSSIGLRAAIAGLLAGSYELLAAKAPDSPGGAAVLPEEYIGIFAALGDSAQGEHKTVDFTALADKLKLAKAEDSPGGAEVEPVEIVGILAQIGSDWAQVEGGNPVVALDDLVAAFEAAGWSINPSGWTEDA